MDKFDKIKDIGKATSVNIKEMVEVMQNLKGKRYAEAVSTGTQSLLALRLLHRVTKGEIGTQAIYILSEHAAALTVLASGIGNTKAEIDGLQADMETLINRIEHGEDLLMKVLKP